jgi:hypothetical protein
VYTLARSLVRLAVLLVPLEPRRALGRKTVVDDGAPARGGEALGGREGLEVRRLERRGPGEAEGVVALVGAGVDLRSRWVWGLRSMEKDEDVRRRGDAALAARSRPVRDAVSARPIPHDGIRTLPKSVDPLYILRIRVTVKEQRERHAQARQGGILGSLLAVAHVQRIRLGHRSAVADIEVSERLLDGDLAAGRLGRRIEAVKSANVNTRP